MRRALPWAVGRRQPPWIEPGVRVAARHRGSSRLNARRTGARRSRAAASWTGSRDHGWMVASHGTLTSLGSLMALQRAMANGRCSLLPRTRGSWRGPRLPDRRNPPCSARVLELGSWTHCNLPRLQLHEPARERLMLLKLSVTPAWHAGPFFRAWMALFGSRYNSSTL